MSDIVVSVPDWRSCIFIMSDTNCLACYGTGEDAGKERFVQTGVRANQRLRLVRWNSPTEVAFCAEPLGKGEELGPEPVSTAGRFG